MVAMTATQAGQACYHAHPYEAWSCTTDLEVDALGAATGTMHQP